MGLARPTSDRKAAREFRPRRKKARPGEDRAFLEITGRLPTLPHTCACSTIGAEGLNYRVRDGNGWVPLAKVTQNLGRPYTGVSRVRRENIDGPALESVVRSGSAYSKFYGQAERAISNGKLNVSPRLHIRPIKLVVCQCPSRAVTLGRSHLGEGFALICIQRLS